MEVLSEVRNNNFDLTPFLNFALEGIIIQSERMLDIIKENNKILLFKDTMNEFLGSDLFPRRKAIHQRQLKILDILLKGINFSIEQLKLYSLIEPIYAGLKNSYKAKTRDLRDLSKLGIIELDEEIQTVEVYVSLNLDLPTQVTKEEFYNNILKLQFRD